MKVGIRIAALILILIISKEVRIVIMRRFFEDAIKVKTGGAADDNKALGGFFIVVAAIMVMCTIIQTGYAIETERNTREQPIQMAAGVHNGVDAFIKRTDANPGDEVLVQISFKNISGYKMDTVAGYVVLPEALEFVSGSTKIYNRTNPNGAYIEDGIAEEWIDLGGYRNYGGYSGAGSISFKVRVSDDPALFVPGVNTFNMTCQIGGYINGVLSSDTHIAYTAVDVVIVN